MPGKIEGINYMMLPKYEENPKEYHRLYLQQYRKATNSQYDKEYYEKNKQRLNAKRAELYRTKRNS